MNTHPVSTPRPVVQETNSCRRGLCSVGLLKSFCPPCLLIGLVMLPFELLARGVTRLARVVLGRSTSDGMVER